MGGPELLGLGGRRLAMASACAARAVPTFSRGSGCSWSWWWVLAPFGAAAVWWAWADATGFTKRRQMEKMDAKRAERRKSQMAALGIEPRKRKKR